jgi:hypothetical protein
MAWFKVDDHFWSHPKTGDLSDGATALWLRAGSWSAGHLTDGFIPVSKLRLFRARQRSITELVHAGLWSGVEGGYLFHDWSDYQPSREAVTARRDATKSRVEAWRKRNRNDVTDEERDDDGTPDVTPPPSRPVPSRPDPLSKESVVGAAKRGSRVPDPFHVDASMRTWAAENTPAADPDRETPQFVDHWAAKAGKDAIKVDWRRAWQTWMRNSQKFAERDGWKPVDNVTQLRDVTAERQAAQKAKWLDDHGITEAEYEANKHDEAWLRRLMGGDSA